MSTALVPVHGITYLITNSINGNRYVGQTGASLSRRLSGHLSEAQKGKNTRFYNATRKHGFDNFYGVVLCSTANQEELDLLEDLHIFLHDGMTREVGYNRKRGGARGKISEETKKIFSAQRQGTGNHKFRGDVLTEDLVFWYEVGCSILKLEKMFPLDSSTIYLRLKKAGVKMRPESSGSMSPEAKIKLRDLFSGGKSPSYRHDVETSVVIELYQSGLSASEIGQRFSVDANTVCNRLRSAKIPLRPSKGSGGRRKTVRIPIEDLSFLHAQGTTTNEIARIYSVSPSSIRKRLAKHKRNLQNGESAFPKRCAAV